MSLVKLAVVALLGLVGCASELPQEPPRPVVVAQPAPVESAASELNRFQAYTNECYVAGRSGEHCEQACRLGDSPACVVVAIRLLRGNNDDLDLVMGNPRSSETFGQGRALLKKTCDKGSHIACGWFDITSDALAGAP